MLTASAKDVLSATDVLWQERFQMPGDWKWDYFTNKEGARIRYGYAVPVKPIGTIVFLPGIIEAGENYFETIKHYLLSGYSVWQMDWRGQGGSDRYLTDRERAYSLGIHNDANDIDQFISTIVSKKSVNPITLVGHSFAGLATLLYLRNHSNLVSAAILVTPAFSIEDPLPVWLIRIMAAFQCSIGKGGDYAIAQGNWEITKERELKLELFSHDYERMQVNPNWLDAHPELRVGGATWAFVKEFLYACGQVNDPQFLKNIFTPVLIVAGSEDRIASPKLQQKISRQLSASEYVCIEGGRHALFVESDEFRDQLLQLIDQFIGKLTRHLALQIK